MHETNTCVHMDFNKSYGCTCSTDKTNMAKIGYGDVNSIPAAEPENIKDEV